jgi:hypothetical protein
VRSCRSCYGLCKTTTVQQSYHSGALLHTTQPSRTYTLKLIQVYGFYAYRRLHLILGLSILFYHVPHYISISLLCTIVPTSLAASVSTLQPQQQCHLFVNDHRITNTALSTMIPVRIPPVPRIIQLRHNVDIQLDHAFGEGQWTVAANLARQRHKSTKDDYYKVYLAYYQETSFATRLSSLFAISTCASRSPWTEYPAGASHNFLSP